MGRPEKIVGILSALVVAVASFVAIQHALNNPMEAREAELERRLHAIAPDQVGFSALRDVDYDRISATFNNNPAVWNELVPPPPPRQKRIPTPNLKRMLEGVVPSLRSEKIEEGTRKVRIVTKNDPRGRYYGVGDEINGVQIRSINDTHVEFGIKHRGKPLTIKIDRR